VFRTFRSRLLWSVWLPFLVMAPILGLMLIGLVEERILLPALAQEMIDQGILIARLGQVLPEIWRDPEAAQAFLRALEIRQPTQVLLLDPSGRLLAGPEERGLLGQAEEGALPERARAGEIVWHAALRGSDSDVVLDVVVPVADESGVRLGYIRLLRRLPDVVEGLRLARRLILGALGIGLAVSGLLGLILAQSLSRPLQAVARAIAESPLEGPAMILPESGPQEVRQLIRTFNRLQTRRAELEEARRLLLRSIVHEFGRLIGALQAALHALRAGAAEDPRLRGELLQGMSQVAGDLTRLLDDLAQTYRQTREPLSLRAQPLDPGSWLRARIPLWAGMARERGLRWEDAVPSELPSIVADPDRLAQALDNLVDNAVKFKPPGGCVRMEAGSGDGKVWIRIQDTGPGIPPEDLPRLFEPFYRGHQEGRPGLGLGLFLARTIVEAHGGRLEVASEPGAGSAFTLILPAAHPGRRGSAC